MLDFVKVTFLARRSRLGIITNIFFNPTFLKYNGLQNVFILSEVWLTGHTVSNNSQWNTIIRSRKFHKLTNQTSVFIIKVDLWNWNQIPKTTWITKVSTLKMFFLIKNVEKWQRKKIKTHAGYNIWALGPNNNWNFVHMPETVDVTFVILHCVCYYKTWVEFSW